MKDHGADAGEVAPALRAAGHHQSHANAGSPPAIAFQSRIARKTGKGDAAPCVASGMAVRRLTPRECERLQGFPDDYTRIEWNHKPADQCPDGPRYKAIGNSMPVPVITWLGQRIAYVDDLSAPGFQPGSDL